MPQQVHEQISCVQNHCACWCTINVTMEDTLLEESTMTLVPLLLSNILCSSSYYKDETMVELVKANTELW